VVPLRVARPGAAEAVLLPALVDTGADCTLIPAAVARHLGLPVIDRVSVQGLGGAVRRVPVHAASAAFGGLRVLARLAAYEAETILGRDLLNRAVALLDGPAQKVALRRGRAGGGRASSKRARSAGRGRRSG
jgi:predicted aspartyl protease